MNPPDAGLLLALAAAHLLADFVLQSDRDVRDKRRPAVFAKHIAAVAVASYVLAGDWRAWPVPLAVGVTHGLIDRAKLGLNRESLAVFAADQAVHGLALLALAWLSPLLFPVTSAWAGLLGPGAARAWVLMAGLILTVHVGGVVVGIGVRPYLGDLLKPAPERATPVVVGGREDRRGLARGGRIIGQLERALIFFLVMIGKPESVAFLVAAKSIFRFGELRDREHRAEAEYITIGTLMSFSWGLAWAWGAWWLYGRI